MIHIDFVGDMSAGIDNIHDHMTQSVIVDDIHVQDDKTIADFFLFLHPSIENLRLAFDLQSAGIIHGQVRDNHSHRKDILIRRNINGEARNREIMNIKLNFLVDGRMVKGDIRERLDLNTRIAPFFFRKTAHLVYHRGKDDIPCRLIRCLPDAAASCRKDHLFIRIPIDRR
ncbi:MAG TPA: hypothetical protein PK936_01210 [Smithellaceae bacterium]|nr:hypothetical protein [Smithellaceae bacterium]